VTINKGDIVRVGHMKPDPFSITIAGFEVQSLNRALGEVVEVVFALPNGISYRDMLAVRFGPHQILIERQWLTLVASEIHRVDRGEPDEDQL
jgi:hypothetical protein